MKHGNPFLNSPKITNVEQSSYQGCMLYRADVEGSSQFSPMFLMEAPSLYDYVAFGQRDNVAPLGDSSRTSGNRCGFYDSESWSEAKKMAIEGHDRYTDKMLEIRTSFETGSVGHRQMTHDVHGDALDMGRVMEGHPECWMHEHVLDPGHGGKIKRIAYNMAISASVSSEIMARRGSVAAAIVDTLEAMGYRCEITIMDVCTWSSASEVSSYVLKQAEDPLNIATLAYSFMSVDVCRRLQFAAVERFTEFGKENHFDTGYGRPEKITNIFDGLGGELPYDLVFDNKAGSLRDQSGSLRDQYGTNEKAKATFKKLMAEYMDEFELEQLEL